MRYPAIQTLTISDDRLAWEARIDFASDPPNDEWALVLGDVIHNLRSALDVLVWSCAAPETLTPSQQRDLAFPILTDASKWDRARRRRLQSVPDDVVERIRNVQPFNIDEPRLDYLAVLHDLDITDKHRLQLDLRTTAAESTVDLAIEFEESTAPDEYEPMVSAPDTPPERGGVLMTGRGVHRMTSAAGSMTASTGLMIHLPFGNFGTRGFIDEIRGRVLEVVLFVAGDVVPESKSELDDPAQ